MRALTGAPSKSARSCHHSSWNGHCQALIVIVQLVVRWHKRNLSRSMFADLRQSSDPTMQSFIVQDSGAREPDKLIFRKPAKDFQCLLPPAAAFATVVTPSSIMVKHWSCIAVVRLYLCCFVIRRNMSRETAMPSSPVICFFSRRKLRWKRLFRLLSRFGHAGQILSGNCRIRGCVILS